ncbi:MAG: divalent metal cation transporter [Opitutaceae bacterium]|jgi:NRAMP (natural resistance-associated macrophage protein)-like metal ion transporter
MLYWISKSIHQVRRLNRRTVLFLAALGPGIITMIADNDAGGISTYTQTGARTGFNLLWAMAILLPMAYYVQEMTVRLGAVTKRGHAEAIFDGFGKFWGWFSIFDLAVINWLTLVTEYIGMTQAMSLFNIPPWITFFVVTFLLTAIVVTGRYWTFEKITLFFCLFNLVYIPAAIWAMHTGNVKEGWTAVGRGFYHPAFGLAGLSGAALLTLIMANIGTTITPWQIFFQQSAVVDKGMDIKDVKYGKIDTFVGSFLTCVVAAFIIIAAAGVFYFNPHNPNPAAMAAHQPTLGPWSKVDSSFHSWQDMDSAAKTAAAMPLVMPNNHVGQWAKLLFSIGLFDAGLLGALCISLATSWALGEVFGWAHSLNRGVRQAPWFYVAYVLMLMSAGVISLVASVDVQNIITIFVQVVAVTLMPAALMFLILLLNDKPLMGEHVNTRWQNIANWSITIFVIVMSTAYGISILFPEWFGA